MPSPCDTCWIPGKCCSGFVLAGGRVPPRGVTALEATIAMAGYDLPFLPLFRDSGDAWRLWCPNLGLDGRCGDYENRPTTCIEYVPGQDKLCAMHGIIADPFPPFVEENCERAA